MGKTASAREWMTSLLCSSRYNEGTSKLSEKTDLLCGCHCPGLGGPYLGSQVATMVKLHDGLSSVTREIVKSGVILHPFLSTSGPMLEWVFLFRSDTISPNLESGSFSDLLCSTLPLCKVISWTRFGRDQVIVCSAVYLVLVPW